MIGEAFRMRRKRRGLTIAQVARGIKTSDRTIMQYETDGLHFAYNDVKGRIDALNKRWTYEEH